MLRAHANLLLVVRQDDRLDRHTRRHRPAELVDAVHPLEVSVVLRPLAGCRVSTHAGARDDGEDAAAVLDAFLHGGSDGAPECEPYSLDEPLHLDPSRADAWRGHEGADRENVTSDPLQDISEAVEDLYHITGNEQDQKIDNDVESLFALIR